jgi:hypothetical protein
LVLPSLAVARMADEETEHVERIEQPLQIGETVRYNAHATTVSGVGVIVERLDNDCLRVKWQDVAVPTSHRRHSLRRAIDRGPPQ